MVTKKFKIFAGVTFALCMNYVIIANILENQEIGLRLPYYHILIGSFLIPLIVLMSWTGFLFYQRSFQRNLFLKIFGMVCLIFFSLGLMTAACVGLFAAHEEQVEIDGVTYVYTEDGLSDYPINFYYEVVNRYLHKEPYTMMIDESELECII